MPTEENTHSSVPVPPLPLSTPLLTVEVTALQVVSKLSAPTAVQPSLPLMKKMAQFVQDHKALHYFIQPPLYVLHIPTISPQIFSILPRNRTQSPTSVSGKQGISSWHTDNVCRNIACASLFSIVMILLWAMKPKTRQLGLSQCNLKLPWPPFAFQRSSIQHMMPGFCMS